MLKLGHRTRKGDAMGTPTKGVLGSLPNPHRDQIVRSALGEILEGKTLQQIAIGHGVTKQTLNHWLMALGDEYQDLRDAYIDSRLMAAEEAITEAADQHSLAQARELLRHSQWMAERRSRSRYGVQAVTGQAGGEVSITINLQGIQPGITLEHE